MPFLALRHAGLDGGAEEVGDRDAGDFARVLEREEDAGARALIGFLREDRDAVEAGDLTSAGTGLTFDCWTVITSATEPMINPAATIARAVRVSPAKRAPRIRATIGFT